MPLHLIKLAVGCESVKEFEGVDRRTDADRQEEGSAATSHPHHAHVRKRADELLWPAGSLYWVIRGWGPCPRPQRLIAVAPFSDKEGIGRCRPGAWSPSRCGVDAAVPPFSGLALPEDEEGAAGSWQIARAGLSPPLPEPTAAGSGDLGCSRPRDCRLGGSFQALRRREADRARPCRD